MSDLPFTSLPPGWKMERLDRLFRVIKEDARIDDPPVSAFIDGVVTLRSNRPDAIIKGSGQEIGYKHIEKGDLVISGMNAHLGGLGISDSSGKCTPVYTVLRKTVVLEERFISFYLWHAAKSGYIKSLVNAVRYNSADFGPETVKRFMVPVPPVEEQRRIADYLECEISLLNALIRKRKRQQELALLLTNYVREKHIMKSSNARMPLKFITRMAYGDALASESRNVGDVPVMSSGGISGSHNVSNTLAPVIVVGRKGSFGSVHWSDDPAFVIDTAYFIDKNFTNCDLRWLFHVLHIVGLGDLSIDVGIPGLSREVAYSKAVPKPPNLNEQERVVSLIEDELLVIDRLGDKIQASIRVLEEFGISLITGAVTGSFDVSTGRSFG